MHWPRHSLGARSTQPSTPCSASGAWGGSRSVRRTSAAVSGLRRRAFFKSATPPAASETESIMWNSEPEIHSSGEPELLNLSHALFTSGETQRGRAATKLNGLIKRKVGRAHV